MKTQTRRPVVPTKGEWKYATVDPSLIGKSIPELNKMERNKPGSAINTPTTNLENCFIEIHASEKVVALIPSGDYDHTFATHEQAEENANKIIKAMNMHDDLVEAIEQCMILINETPVTNGGEALYPKLQRLLKQAEQK